jgi:hypothetical protein
LFSDFFPPTQLIFVFSGYRTGNTDTMSEKNDIFPPFARYDGQDSFFGGEPPLSKGIGYLVVLGFGGLFSIITTVLVLLNKYFGNQGEITSEHFK